MEPSTDNSGDRKAQIQDFNAITQNQDENVALHYLEMSAFDLNVYFLFVWRYFSYFLESYFFVYGKSATCHK